jgi:DNA-binding transcriptional LysR family regulator
MELRHLRYFVAVAEELSFTRASARLHVVQSGVSSAIQGLERELGAALFDRDRHRVSLTEAGEALLPEARATLAAAQAAADAVAQAQAGLRGSLTIGTMLPSGQVELPALLGRFRRAHPAVAVRLAVAGAPALARQVLSGRLDLALLALPGKPPAGLEVHLLSEERLVAVCALSHPLAGAPVTLALLAGEPFVDFPPDWGNRAVADRAFAAAGLERQVLFEAPDFAGVAGLVRNGLGVALLPASALPALAGVATAEVSGGDLRWQACVAVPAARRCSAAARAFLAGLVPAGG